MYFIGIPAIDYYKENFENIVFETVTLGSYLRSEIVCVFASDGKFSTGKFVFSDSFQSGEVNELSEEDFLDLVHYHIDMESFRLDEVIRKTKESIGA